MSTSELSESSTALESEDFQRLEGLLNVSGAVLSELASHERFGPVLGEVVRYTTQREAQLEEYQTTLQDYGEQLDRDPAATGTVSRLIC